MIPGKMAINKICKIHYRTLQVVYNNFTDSYDPLHSINKDNSIHQKQLQYLVVGACITLEEVNPELMWIYSLKNPISYDLEKGDKVFLPPDLFLFRGTLLWNNLPSSVENSETLNQFNFKLKAQGKLKYCVSLKITFNVF